MFAEKPLDERHSELMQKKQQQDDHIQLFRTSFYLTRMCTMVDNFSEKWSDKARDPERFLEVAQELRNLKRRIDRYASGRNIQRYAPEERVEKWMFEICIRDDASTLIQTHLGLPFSNKAPLKEQLEQFISMKPSKIADLQEKACGDLTPEIEALGKEFSENLEKNAKKLPKKSSVEEADDDVSWREQKLKSAAMKKNRMLDYAIIVDALTGGADKPIEEQIKDFRLIVRNKGERRSEFSERLGDNKNHRFLLSDEP